MGYKKISLFCVSILLVLSSIAQVIDQDISKINIDALTDDQIVLLISRANLSGLSEDEMERKALETGFTQDQVAKLKSRVAKLNKKGSSTEGNTSYDRSTGNGPVNYKDFLEVKDKKNKVFGTEFFSNQNLTFEPNLSIATPSNYILGPGDKLILDIYGYSELQTKLEVSPDGYIRIPNVGPVLVSGLSIEEAKVRVKKQLATVYGGINTGKTSFQLALGQIRSIRVTIIGEVMHPATYTLPALATIANAMYLSGGPTLNGSLRYIDLVRDGKKVISFDFYDFLLYGDLSKNLLLRDQDVIRVNAYSNRVELSGAVKRQAIYEIKGNETLKDVIKFSGGFADTANTELITAYRISGREKEIVNLSVKNMDSLALHSGDSIVVNGIINRFNNRISISGAVFYPGNYSLKQISSLRDLITSSQIKENAFRDRGLLRRLQEDYRPLFISFNINDILSGKSNIPLVREDSIYLYSISDIVEKYTVTINGEVNIPGTFAYADSMKLQDLILAANGFKESASNTRIEIARRIRNYDPAIVDSLVYAIVITLDVNKDYSSVSDIRNYILQPYDIVSVRKSPKYKEQITVKIEGEVNYPGEYTIQNRSERLTDLVNRAGGLKSQAFPEGALLTRNTFETIKDTSLLNSKLKILRKQTGIR
jgi:protein involved in polysaccharide export with SLBB domain